MSEENRASQVPAEMDAAKKKSLPRRLGCWLLVAIWFLILSTPCGLFYLAANGEIRLEHSQIPEPHAHPRLLISLISESTDRGLRIERSTITSADEDARLCVETAVTFLLWQSSGGNQNVQYCDCYLRADAGSAWQFASTYSAACERAGTP